MFARVRRVGWLTGRPVTPQLEQEAERTKKGEEEEEEEEEKEKLYGPSLLGRHSPPMEYIAVCIAPSKFLLMLSTTKLQYNSCTRG